jgi:hypothetical protein
MSGVVDGKEGDGETTPEGRRGKGEAAVLQPSASPPGGGGMAAARSLREKENEEQQEEVGVVQDMDLTKQEFSQVSKYFGIDLEELEDDLGLGLGDGGGGLTSAHALAQAQAQARTQAHAHAHAHAHAQANAQAQTQAQAQAHAHPQVTVPQPQPQPQPPSPSLLLTPIRTSPAKSSPRGSGGSFPMTPVTPNTQTASVDDLINWVGGLNENEVLDI